MYAVAVKYPVSYLTKLAVLMLLLCETVFILYGMYSYVVHDLTSLRYFRLTVFLILPIFVF